MQFVPLELAQELWKATPELNWSAFYDRVQERLEKGPAIEGVNPTTLLQSVKYLSQIGTPFPLSAQDLYKVLNEQIQNRTL
uniref:Uncharacterized protein n=1 Tax=Thermosporothrix sp. COM3 TaxID=2490863 RepID=A0A455SK75_9CHLR|nr:hypothetical protein KTC_25290 [Thermosporothrix sp. COM3]